VGPVKFEKFKELWQRQLGRDPGLTGGDGWIATCISWHFNRNKPGYHAWPSLDTITRVSGASRRACVSAIERLEANGHLRVIRIRKGVKNAVNHYLPLLKEAPQSVTRNAVPDKKERQDLHQASANFAPR
jgi:hypothetical protein